jgi:hypothetical protein
MGLFSSAPNGSILLEIGDYFLEILTAKFSTGKFFISTHLPHNLP